MTAVVKLGPMCSGESAALYNIPRVSMFPAHDLALIMDSDGGLGMYIASPFPEYYYLSGGDTKIAGALTPPEVSASLWVLWFGLLFVASVIPILYVLSIIYDFTATTLRKFMPKADEDGELGHSERQRLFSERQECFSSHIVSRASWPLSLGQERIL